MGNENSTLNDTIAPLDIEEQVVTNVLEFSKIFYVIGVLILISAYTGPYFYYKYYKKKNFQNSSSIASKHTV